MAEKTVITDVLMVRGGAGFKTSVVSREKWILIKT
jgi:hypothetical protein